jgi:hypothetical protein
LEEAETVLITPRMGVLGVIITPREEEEGAYAWRWLTRQRERERDGQRQRETDSVRGVITHNTQHTRGAVV